MENKELTYEQSFTQPIIKYGRLTNLLGVAFSFIPALVVCFCFDAFPGVQNILSGWLIIFSIYGVYSVVEPVSYYPVLGLAGTYMAFLGGNISNMRVPASAVAQENLGVEAGTRKAELVSTLAIAGSLITNALVVTIAALGGAALMSILPAVVLDAFNYVSPAIFGAVFAMYASKDLKLGTFAIALSAVMLLVIKVLPAYIMIPAAVFGTIAMGFFFYAQDKKKAQK